MKVVIDIPEEVYKDLKNKYAGITDGFVVSEAVANGTPLPKGHGRLIDADDYIDNNDEGGWLEYITIDEFNKITPTIIDADRETNE